MGVLEEHWEEWLGGAGAGRGCSLTSGVLPICSGWLGGGGGILAPLLSLGLDHGVQIFLLSAESLTEGWLVSGPICPWCGRLWIRGRLFAALLGLSWPSLLALPETGHLAVPGTCCLGVLCGSRCCTHPEPLGLYLPDTTHTYIYN